MKFSKKTIKQFLLILVLIVIILPGLGAAPNPGKIDPTKLTIEEMYNVITRLGKSARVISFSKSDRYVAFLWNPYTDIQNSLLLDSDNTSRGYDLYIYDISSSKLDRVTSVEIMKRFDPPEDYENFIRKRNQIEADDKHLQQTFFDQRDYLAGKNIDLSAYENEEIEKLKNELSQEKKKKEDIKPGEEKKETGKELEIWELRDKLKEKKEKDKVSTFDLYPGVTWYQWSYKTDDLIFQYRGDLFRYFPGNKQLIRLTMTDENETLVSYAYDNNGYYYEKDGKIFKVTFQSSYVQQINHELSKDGKLFIRETAISPNDRWMLILGSMGGGNRFSGNQEIMMMSYKKRFAEPVKVRRLLPEEVRGRSAEKLFLREITSTNYGKEPDPIFEIPGGDSSLFLSDIIWAKDGSQYAFTTWEREKSEFKIYLGKPIPGQKPEVFFEKTEKNNSSRSYAEIHFTPDGKKLVVTQINEDGFEQPVVMDIKTKTQIELIKGKFESTPVIDISNDGEYVYVISDKENPAMHGLYKVSIKTSEMVQIGKKGYMYRESTVSNNGKWIAAVYGNWSEPPELYLLQPSASFKPRAITSGSHSPEFAQFNLVIPELFTFKNRHGDELPGMLFKPAGWKPEDKRPCLVYYYGGPLSGRHMVEADNFSPVSYFFQAYMAAKHGFVTINIDTRGESGFGMKFSEANFGQPGKPQVEDLEDLAAKLHSGFGVDDSRIGIHGWSFGGFQTLKTLFSSPDTFACGIAGAGPTEWENYNAFYSGTTIGKSEKGRPSLRKYSLIPLAKRLKKPLLLIHGMLDDNVLYQDTVNIYRALLESGKETLVDLFLDPDGAHHLGGAVKDKGLYHKYEQFFLEHLK